jgi:hypothetical protein
VVQLVVEAVLVLVETLVLAVAVAQVALVCTQ